jgi:hypothetical protein
MSLKSFGLDLKKLVGLDSDECSTMLGNKNDVAMKLRRSSPSLVSFHYPVHHLQFAILDIADKIPSSPV